MGRLLRGSPGLAALTAASLGYIVASPWLIDLWWWGDLGERVQLAYGVAGLAAAPLGAAVAEVVSGRSALAPLVFGHRALASSLALAVLSVVAIPLFGYVGVAVAAVLVPAAAAALAVAWVRPSGEEEFLPAVYLGLAGCIPVAVAVAGWMQTSLPISFFGLLGTAVVLVLLLQVRRRSRTGREVGSFERSRPAADVSAH